ncbi:MAG TPA: hypothetical protein ENI20_05085 [Bacteroides sp.]|nr:hypothetical protein [Bacteroides sp.]
MSEIKILNLPKYEDPRGNLSVIEEETNIPNNTLWYGNSSLQMGYVCDCGHNLDDALKCGECQSKYQMEHNTMVRSD